MWHNRIYWFYPWCAVHINNCYQIQISLRKLWWLGSLRQSTEIHTWSDVILFDGAGQAQQLDQPTEVHLQLADVATGKNLEKATMWSTEKFIQVSKMFIPNKHLYICTIVAKTFILYLVVDKTLASSRYRAWTISFILLEKTLLMDFCKFRMELSLNWMCFMVLRCTSML